MNERAKITANHLSRQAIIYLRQSSAAQVENNRESTDRQYALAAKARELGWPDRIVVIDEDLGLSGSGFVARARATRSQGSPTRKFSADGAVCCSGRRASRSGAKAESTTRGGFQSG